MNAGRPLKRNHRKAALALGCKVEIELVLAYPLRRTIFSTQAPTNPGQGCEGGGCNFLPLGYSNCGLRILGRWASLGESWEMPI